MAVITVGELQLIIATLISNNPKAVHTKVSLCLPEVETYVTRIVRANNEGDDSVFWLHTDRDAEKILVSGFKAS